MKRRIAKKQFKTDWARVDAMKDEDIDCSDNPELGPEFFKKATFWPGTKNPITIRLDPDVLWFFVKRGKHYKAAINAVLRKYVKEQSRRAR